MAKPNFIGERHEEYWYKIYDKESKYFIEELGEFGNTYEAKKGMPGFHSDEWSWEFVHNEGACDKAKRALEANQELLNRLPSKRYLLIQVRNSKGTRRPPDSLKYQLMDPSQAITIVDNTDGSKTVSAHHYMALI